jgi:hypothetical protein
MGDSTTLTQGEMVLAAKIDGLREVVQIQLANVCQEVAGVKTHLSKLNGSVADLYKGQGENRQRIVALETEQAHDAEKLEAAASSSTKSAEVASKGMDTVLEVVKTFAPFIIAGAALIQALANK